MKRFVLIVWLVAGIAVALWHFGPGQIAWQRDAAAAEVRTAIENYQSGQPESAVPAFERALALLPPEDVESRAKARIGLAKARLESRGLTEAREDMEMLVAELPPTTDPKLMAIARTTLAEAQYYNTWLMRLEGAPREEWEPEIESARQLFRNSAETALEGDVNKEQTLKNLESTIRLARLDLTDLQAMPIPSQCRGCKSCRGKNPGQKKKTDSKPQDVRSASGALDMDNSGD